MNYVLVKCFEHLLGDRVLHKEAWVATHLGTHLLIQVQICQICWQGYLGSVDHVDKLYYILSAELNIKDETELRFIPMGKEVTERRALLRYSRFFLNDTDVINIHGEVSWQTAEQFWVNNEAAMVPDWRIYI